MAMRSLGALGLGVLALAPASAAAKPRIAEFAVALHAPRGAQAASAAHTAVVAPGRRFDLVGLRWRGAAAPRHPRVQVRVHGRWSRWVEIGTADSGPHGSDPVWAGGADALRLRWSGAPRHLRLRFVRITHRPHPRLPARAAQGAQAPAMIPRSQWDPAGQCPPRQAPEYGDVQVALVHHTVSANDYGPQDSAAMVLAICRYHRNSNGWNDIGYNFLVDRYGQLFEGRAGGVDQPVVGAQAQGFNDQTTSIADLGTYSSSPATDASLDAMADLLAWKLTISGVPVTGSVRLVSEGGSLNRWPAGRDVTFQRISGHRDAGRTECPGDALYAQLPDLRELAAERAPLYAPAAPPLGSGQVTLDAAATTLTYPQPAELSGTLTGGGTVSIQVESAGRFITIAHAQPAADGTWATSLRFSAGHVLRALQVLPDGTAGAASDTVRLQVAPRLTARASAPRVLSRHGVVLSGTIAPARRSLSLTLAIKRGGRYIAIARYPVLSRSGRFRVVPTLRHATLYRLRVSYAGDAAAAPTYADTFVRAVTRRSALNGGTAARAG